MQRGDEGGVGGGGRHQEGAGGERVDAGDSSEQRLRYEQRMPRESEVSNDGSNATGNSVDVNIERALEAPASLPKNEVLPADGSGTDADAVAAEKTRDEAAVTKEAAEEAEMGTTLAPGPKVNPQDAKRETSHEKKNEEKKERKKKKQQQQQQNKKTEEEPSSRRDTKDTSATVQGNSHEALAPSVPTSATGDSIGDEDGDGGGGGGGGSGGGDCVTGQNGRGGNDNGSDGNTSKSFVSGNASGVVAAKAATGASGGSSTAGTGSAGGHHSGQRASSVPKDSNAPTALDKVLEKLGFLPQSRLTGEAAAAAELESKYRAVALAARADSQTLPLRLERQSRLREQAQRNVDAEADELARALHRLNYLCKEAESVELLGAARDQILFVLKAAKYVAATAETMGALRLEARMSGWMETSLQYNDQLKHQLETVRSEQEEMRRVLNESGASFDTGSPQTSAARRNTLLSAKLGSKRRASIAAPPRSAASSSTSTTTTTTTKDQGRLSLAFIPGSPASSPPILRLGTGRRPLSSASSDTTVGGTGIESSTPSPSIMPEDFTPCMDDVVVAPLEEDVIDPGSSDESVPHRNSLPRLSVVGLQDSEAEVLSVPHVRRRESTAVTAMSTMAPPPLASSYTSRSLYQRTAISDLIEYIWPPDMFACVQHARWLLVRILVLAAIWCIVQAFMSPADACDHFPAQLPMLNEQKLLAPRKPN